MRSLTIFCGLVCCGVCVGVVAPAAAKTAGTASYPYEQVWPTAVRFLRVDEGVTILEKDAEAGYIVFELEDDKRKFRGSFEIARVKDDAGRDASRLVVRIRDRPAYMEQGLIDRLLEKLHDEIGEPAPPPPRERKPAAKGDKAQPAE
jgi:hypothetical protein